MTKYFWIDPRLKELWLYGGEGYPSSILADLWKYDISSGSWAWMGGSQSASVYANFGTLGVASNTTSPGSVYRGESWYDAQNLESYVFGGYLYNQTSGYANAVFKFSDRPGVTFCLSCNATSCVPNNTICSGSTSCINGYCLVPPGGVAPNQLSCAAPFLSGLGRCCNNSCAGACGDCSSGICSPNVALCDVSTQLCLNSQCLWKNGQNSTLSSSCASGILSQSGQCCNASCAGACRHCRSGFCENEDTRIFTPFCAGTTCLGQTSGWTANNTCGVCLDNVPGRCGLDGQCDRNVTSRCSECTVSYDSRPSCSTFCRLLCEPGRDASLLTTRQSVCKVLREPCGGDNVCNNGFCVSGLQTGAPSDSTQRTPTNDLNVSDGSGNAGMIAGIVVGVLVFIALIVLAVILVFRRLRRANAQRLTTLRDTVGMDERMKPILNINSAELVRGRSLGDGSYGAVYEGKYKGQPVAIKVLNAVAASAIGGFFREASLMMAVSSHPNVVQLLGMCQQQQNFSLVMELLPRGSLASFVQTSDWDKMSDGKKKKLCRGIAEGMSSLALQKIVHRDLAARNILLTENLVPKVSDFGFSRVVGEDGVGNTATDVGPIRWMPAESLRDRVFSEKSDVWSYGCLLLEIFTKHQPFPTLDVFKVAIFVRDQHGQPEVPTNAPHWAQVLMSACFALDPNHRPTFAEIALMLTDNS